ncbi:HK97 family phage prohead protease [Streptomyces stelliscabiei]|uniref:HK97 family phage prohead protease n=1 Tax=Streptomyces stelliscabiei TaxID=146820 RepID=UPI0029AF9273|nr:HK97 family phage prohead protease [Streptomyces stelliscabiei]MDX2521370.1 HK97 family phage prohead protease [Streptomyces stelliscabiei]
MTDTATLRQEAAQARASAAGSTSMAVPQDRGQVGSPARLDAAAPEIRYPSNLRAKKITRDDGLDWYEVEGYASAFEQAYEMYDMFGPYTEIVSAGAADATLAADPDVVFRFNHAGTPMATTRNGRLQLWADAHGLGQRAWLNPKRNDVQDLVRAIEDEDVREQSFMFRITSGQWSPDYTEYRIQSFDLERGDVGPVTYGANPNTSIAARSGEFLALIPSLPTHMAREAYARLAQRSDLTAAPVPAPQMPAPARAAAPTATGRSISMLRTQLLVEQGED